MSNASAADPAEISSLVPGVPNSVLFVAMPLVGNFAVITWYTGYFRALSIPLWYVSVNSVQVFVVGLFSLPVGYLLLVIYFALKYLRKTKKFDESPVVRTIWLGGTCLVAIVLSYVWGYMVPIATPRWAVVAGAPGCALLIRTGDTVIAGDYDPQTRRLRGRITLYAIDAVPTFDAYRVELDLRGGTARVPSERPSACPNAQKRDVPR